MATSNTKNDPRGSQWRKWDLHLHAPSRYTCAKRDDFLGKSLEEKIQKFIEELNGLKDISVLGVTDYFSIEGYRKTVEYTKELKNIDLIVPNVELRITPVTGNNRKINLHFIANPHALSEDDIESFLHKFEFKYGRENYSCKRDDLIKLGKKIDSGLSDEAAFQKGLNEFSVTYKEFFEKYNDSGEEFKKNTLVGVSNSSSDGNSGIKDITAIRNIIYQGVDFIFSGNPTDPDYFTGRGVDYHGSKSGKVICVPDKNRFCWIKADPTFEGLKQIIYEPYERVKIQQKNPDDYVKYIIDDLEIKSSDTNLLVPQKILFNRNLVSIIGGKGTGKSSLLALIANSSEIYDPHPAFEGKKTDVDFQFLNKDSEAIKYSLDISQKSSGYTLPILYIAQEELAKESSKKTVVRQAYLNEIGIEDISINYSDLSVQIEGFLNQIVKQEELIGELKEKVGYDPEEQGENFEKFLAEKIKKQKEIIKLTGTKSTKDLIDSITEIIKHGRKLNQWLQDPGFTKIESEIQNVNRIISSFNIALEKLGIKDGLEGINIKSNKDKFAVIKKQIEENLVESRQEYSNKKKELEAVGIKEDIQTLLKTLETVQNELTLFEETKEKYNLANEEITSVRNEVVKLFKTDSKDGVFEKVKEAKTTIQKKYKDFHEQRKDSEIFKILFQGVEIKPDVFFDVKSLEEEITNCFFKDHVKDVKKEIFGSAKPTYQIYCEWVSDKFWTFFQEHIEKNNFKSRIVGEELDGKSMILDIVFRNWHNYISVSTAIENDFDGKMKEIEDMSTGELATVLLKLKLVTEGLDKQIILLDQPEDHLDNNFIANGLVDLMKKLKLERQIIVATHNANLVVGADSEQVIIANFNQSDKKYMSGSLENPTIQEAIIKILEGGTTAFEKRMKRYNLAKI